MSSLFGELLPDWIDPEIWAAFLDNRKKMGKRYAATDYAKMLILNELGKLRAAGNPPNAVLSQSIRNNYLDVYPLKDRRFQPVQVSGAVPEHKFADVVQTPEAVAAGRAQLLEARRKIKGG
jgi:hypothetical protein